MNILKQYVHTRIKNDLPLPTQININKMETAENNLNSVYKLNCEQCNLTNIGEISREFSTILKECETS